MLLRPFSASRAHFIGGQGVRNSSVSSDDLDLDDGKFQQTPKVENSQTFSRVLNDPNAPGPFRVHFIEFKWQP